MGQLDQPAFRRFGPRERTFLVSEQLGLHQTLWNRGAIHADKRLILAVAALHDGLCHQFLARAALPPHQNRGIAVSDRLNRLVHPLHRRAAPNHPTEGGLAFHMLSQATSFELQAALINRPREHDL